MLEWQRVSAITRGHFLVNNLYKKSHIESTSNVISKYFY